MRHTVYIVADKGSAGIVGNIEEVPQMYSGGSYLNNRKEYLEAHWNILRIFASQEAALACIKDDAKAVFMVFLVDEYLELVSESESRITSQKAFANFSVTDIQKIIFSRMTFGREISVDLSASIEKAAETDTSSAMATSFAFAPGNA